MPPEVADELASTVVWLSGHPLGIVGAPGHLVAAQIDAAKAADRGVSASEDSGARHEEEETPHQSPWWLTLLRLVMAALIVLALAEPVFNPREELPAKGDALALVIDNGWASAPDWDRRVATAGRLIADAHSSGVPVVWHSPPRSRMPK